MSFGREKRLLLGWLALVAPLPLPFNQVVEWPVLLAYWVAVAIFLLRAFRDPGGWLPSWAMNLLGLLYLPFLGMDLSLFWRGQFLRPLVHLALYTLAVKLFALREEKDKWHAFMGIFFLTLAAMGTSVHPSVVVYLIVVLVLHLRLLTRFASFHALAVFGGRRVDEHDVPIRGFVALGSVLILVAAVPIFALLPRLPTPYIVGAGRTADTLAVSASFSQEIGLDVIGRLRASRAVAMRFVFETPARADYDPRFKAATYEVFTGTGWRRSPFVDDLFRRGREGYFRVAPGRAGAWMKLWLRSQGASDLVLPVQAVLVDVLAPGLRMDRGGAAAASFPATGTLEYRAGLASAPVSAGVKPEGESLAVTLETAGVSERVAALAAEVIGDEQSAAAGARRLERYLRREYDYTLDFLGAGGARPVEDFLFRHRRGHCEYFASAMVLMLRSQGIPSRLVTGFLGAEYNPLENYYIVRQSNRHAWVEAYLPADGWQVFDPTPPDGRPQSARGGLGLMFSQAYDYLVFRWDRYVLTYGLGDQLDLAVGLRSLWRGLWRLWSQRPERPQAAPPSPRSPEPVGEERAGEPWSPAVLPWLAVVIALSVWVVVLVRGRRRLTATRAYAVLRRRLERADPGLDRSVPPLEVYRRLVGRFPHARLSAARLFDLYLRESFGGRLLDQGELDGVRRALRELLKQAV